MTDRIFVDTNLLVYAHDTSADGKHEKARDLLLNLWENRTGCLSIQVLQEFYVTVTQKVSSPMGSSTAKEIIRDISFWNVHQPNSDDVIRAIDLHQHYQVSFWDAMVLQSAAQMECSLIWSEDLNPGQFFDGVKVENPFV